LGIDMPFAQSFLTGSSLMAMARFERDLLAGGQFA